MDQGKHKLDCGACIAALWLSSFGAGVAFALFMKTLIG